MRASYYQPAPHLSHRDVAAIILASTGTLYVIVTPETCTPPSYTVQVGCVYEIGRCTYACETTFSQSSQINIEATRQVPACRSAAASHLQLVHRHIISHAIRLYPTTTHHQLVMPPNSVSVHVRFRCPLPPHTMYLCMWDTRPGSSQGCPAPPPSLLLLSLTG